MDVKSLLAKSITLLYRESQLNDKTDNSCDLVRTVLEDIKISDISIGLSFEKDTIVAIKHIALEMCNNGLEHQYDKNDLLQTLQIATREDEKYFEILKQNIDNDISDPQLKRLIINIRKTINTHFKEEKISNILSMASQKFKFERAKIKNVNEYINDIVTQLESLQVETAVNDPAIMGAVDIGNDKNLRDAFEISLSINKGSKVYKLGWQDINDMLQGGLRPAECVILGALQHNYKTGMKLSILAQIAQHNKPHTVDPNKKPLIVSFAFEDNVENELQYLYQYLKYDETLEKVDIKNLTVEEMSKYVREKLEINGFKIKIFRVDPGQWTYKAMFNKIIELEAEGYNIEVMFVDYLALLPTTGCLGGGITGGDVLDLFRRWKNFCKARNILHITPHQLSTEANQLLRNGIPGYQLPKEIVDKGYFDKTKALGREYDLCLLMAKFKHNKNTYLAVQRDKHKIPTIVSDELLYTILPFPDKMPIPSDINREKISFRSLSEIDNRNTETLFKL